MKILKYLIYIIASCVLWLMLSACHLEGEKTSPPPAPKKTSTSDPVESKESLVWSGSLDLTNPKRYHYLLRDQRKCDPCTAYIGPLRCKHFDSKPDIEMKFEKQELPSKVTVKIKPYHSRSGLPFHAYLGACGFTVSPEEPFELKGTAKYWNDYTGFHVQLEETKGFGALSYLIIRSRYSNPVENGVLDIVAYYGGSASQRFEFGKADLDNPDIDDGYTHQPGGR